MNFILRHFFFFAVVRPLLLIFLGIQVRHKNRLPLKGPFIVAANHNSHLDALVLISLFPLKLLRSVHPVAAMDYFLRNRLMAWFSLKIIGIIPLSRKSISHKQDPLQPVCDSLEKNEIVIIFPEGSRGEAEHMSQMKTGIAHIAARYPEIPTIPIFLHGLGKSLPRNETLFVPFRCDVFVGEPIYWKGDRKEYMSALEHSLSELAHEEHLPEWK